MITPRQTRLFSTADLATFRLTILSCVAETSAWDRRASAVIVPSHAAADQLRWTLEQRTLDAGTAQVLPLLLTRDELYAELHRRADAPPPLLGPIERLVCGRAAADEALASGMDPPFQLRPGLVSEFLGLYDELQRRHRSVPRSCGRRPSGLSLVPFVHVPRRSETGAPVPQRSLRWCSACPHAANQGWRAASSASRTANRQLPTSNLA